MSRAFYSEYVNHCLRFYTRCPKPKFKSNVDKHNWIACDNAFKGFSENDRELLAEIYREENSISDNVCRTAKSRGIKQDYIWKTINKLERKVAKQRGLI